MVDFQLHVRNALWLSRILEAFQPLVSRHLLWAAIYDETKESLLLECFNLTYQTTTTTKTMT